MAGPLLLTGFEPFGGDRVNSSWELAQALQGEAIGGLAVQTVCLPCRFDSSLQALDEALRCSRPALVLALGQAASRPCLSFERVAMNWIDARIPDNAGAQPLDEPVIAGAPAAFFTTLPIKRMLAAAQAVGVPAEVSFSAGSFVCNQVFYGLQHRLRRRPALRSGFLHVPAFGGALSLADLARGLRAALQAAVEEGADARVKGGVID
jgi:pyroglutamyl-peptidase